MPTDPRRSDPSRIAAPGAAPAHRFVVTGVRSRTHLVHIAAYLRRELASRDGELQVRYVEGGRFLGHAQVTRDDVHRLLPDDPRLHVSFPTGADRRAAGPGPLTYVSVGVPGLKPWAALQRNDIRRRVHVVVTDEGLGTYGDWRTRRDAWRRQGGREPWPTIRSLVVEAGRRRLTGERFALYDGSAGWAPDPLIAAEFRRGVRPVPGTEDPADAERVVLLTQPWVELGVLDDAAYAAFVARVAGAVRAAGRRLQVRPHPAEDPARYAAWEVLDGDRPAELDARIVSAGAVIGGTSTALLNLAALYGRPAHRLLVPGLEHLESELGRDQRALLSTHLAAPARPEHLPGLLSRA